VKVRPPTTLGLLGIGFGLAGAVLIVAAGELSFAGGGAWLALAAAIPLLLGIGNVYRSFAWPAGAGPLRLGAAVNLAAVPPLAVLAMAAGGLDLELLLAVPGLVAAQLTASTVMYLTFFRLQAVGGPTYLSQIGYVGAVIGVGAGVLLLGESYPPRVWAGIGVVAVGIALSTLAQLGWRRPQ
jgi:drug/metabolite transporter (DMT)-like permease